MMGLDFYHLFYHFVFFSFIGWLAEAVYAYATKGKFVNRNFLASPFLTIYGLGGVGVALVSERANGSLALFIVGAIIVTSVVEYFSAIFVEKVFHRSWWDYRDEPMNIQGRVSLKYSVFWGILSVIGIKLMYPRMQAFIETIPRSDGVLYARIIAALLVVDTIVGVGTIFQANRRAKELERVLKKLDAVRASSVLDPAEKEQRIAELSQEYDTIVLKPIYGYSWVARELPPLNKTD